jgi:putative DNA primase/helicase
VSVAANGVGLMKTKPELQGAEIGLRDVAVWHEPVDLAGLLDDVVGTVTKFVAMPKAAAATVALYVVLTYVTKCVDVLPILAITSPVMRCGKSTLLTLVYHLAARALMAANVTPATVFRIVHKHSPALVLDEADTFIHDNEALRGILNSGHYRAGAYVLRCEGDQREPRQFSTWCAKVIALIGTLPRTLEDRSIVVGLRRRSPGEKLQRFKVAKLAADLHPLRQRAARWAHDNGHLVQLADPEAPAELDDRAADNWRSLLAIADLAGETWAKRARAAAVILSRGRAHDDDDDKGVALLHDMRQIFASADDAEHLPTEAIIAALLALDARPWATFNEYGRDKSITPRQFANLLRPFDVRPVDIRVGERKDNRVVKGYRRAEFDDAFDRYLPSQALPALLVNGGTDLDVISDPLPASVVADEKQAVSARNHSPVALVAAKTGGADHTEACECADCIPGEDL